MPLLTLDLPHGGYPIRIESGAIRRPEMLRTGVAPGQRIAIITNEVVAPLYLAPVAAAFADHDPLVITLPDGETEKALATIDTIVDRLLAAHCDRQTMLVALGGGVVGDITGFAASVYQRGVPFIQIPTTLLAQVDSSVGGKTGVNHPRGKNMIGSFHQPASVVIDPDTLRSLPVRERAAGLAEVIKYGAIGDATFFSWLEDNMARLVALDPTMLALAIERSCRAKAAVVMADEREAGIRALLNFGHTFGHAIEAGAGYGNWLHGEAVGVGMLMAADLSSRLGLLAPPAEERLRRLVAAAGLPTEAPALEADRFLELMAVDKKAQGGRIRFVLLRALGRAEILADIPEAQLRATLARFHIH